MQRDHLRLAFDRRFAAGLAAAAVGLATFVVVGAAPAAAHTIVRSGHGPAPAPDIRQGMLARSKTAQPSVPGASSRPKTGPSCTPMFSQGTSNNSINVGNELDSLVVLNPQDAWAAGFNYTTAANSERTLLAHFDGVSWQVTPSPNYGDGRNILNGITANDPNDVWAVGDWVNSSIEYNEAIHWNGSGWATSNIPQPSGSAQFLSSVSAVSSSNVWTVGSYWNGTIYVGVAYNWNGSTWSTVTLPQLGSGNNIPQSVFARTASDIWVVGDYLPNVGLPAQITNPYQTLVEHWNGSAWSTSTSANPLATHDNILVIVDASSATDAWAVGYTFDGTVNQTLVEHLVAGNWVTSPSLNESPTADSIVYGLDDISPTNIWATGFGRTSNTVGGSSLVEHWDGATWTIDSADSPGGTSGQSLNAVASLPGNDLWAVGGWFTATTENTLAEQLQLPPPTAVSATTPSDQSAMVSWSAPAFDCGFTTTGYQVTASDGCTVLGTMASATSPATFTPITNGSPVTFTVQAVSASLGAETPSMPSGFVVPAGATAPTAESACTSKQYQYVSPDPVNFVDMDPGGNLTLTVTPGVASTAIISGNSDLWTANAGLNQDIGILVKGGTFGTTGTIVAWKESGGFAGTFSPNAAAVQAVASLAAGTAYTVKLQWKSNKAFPGATIFAGAGPVEGDFRFNGAGAQGFSPTRLSLHLVPNASNAVFPASSTQQYTLANSDGVTFKDIDATNLSEPVAVAVDSVAVITANIDLWTANAGFNQDVAVVVDGTMVGWKESGGFAGTFSPNAAFVQVVVPLTAAGSPHTVKLQWKTNKPASGATIFAGAGPWPSGGSVFSPTRLTVWLLPSASVGAKVSTSQYTLANSDGAGWTPIDTTNLQINVAPSVNGSYALSGNADLWTANAGFNQDIGIFVSGGIYGSGTLVAWKESGGFAGTFSPNAAFVDSVVHLPGPGTYTVWLAWKTNKQGAGSTIFVGAGPISALFSPSRLTALQLSTP